jgi:hypothetical protein
VNRVCPSTEVASNSLPQTDEGGVEGDEMQMALRVLKFRVMVMVMRVSTLLGVGHLYLALT